MARKPAKIRFADAKFSLEHPLRSLSLLPLDTLRPRLTRAVYLGLYRAYRPRRFHAFCVGAFKSGTHSIAGMLMRRYRSSHEPRVPELIGAVLAASRQEISQRDLQQFVHHRDRTLWLEMESSAFSVHILDLLVRDFPDARFILTIRDCYSWVDSALNQQLGRKLPKHYESFLRYWIAPGSEYAPAELALKENGLYPLKSYFKAWANHNRRVIDTVPPDRLLVIRTNDISKSPERIARFLGIPPRTLDRDRSHSFRTHKKFDLLSAIDRDFVREAAQESCGPLMSRFFPERTGL